MGQRTNYVLIDYENVQPKVLAGLDADHFKVVVFVGANQSKIAFETAAALQGMGDKATYVQICGNGANALDFHIAFYIGQFAQQVPTPCFHIISKDKGFDPLIEHLTGRKIHAMRWRDISEIPLLKIADAKDFNEEVDAIASRLQHPAAPKPKSIGALSNTIKTFLQREPSAEELQTLIAALAERGVFVLSAGKVKFP